jgi:hypothetical protein
MPNSAGRPQQMSGLLPDSRPNRIVRRSPMPLKRLQHSRPGLIGKHTREWRILSHISCLLRRASHDPHDGFEAFVEYTLPLLEIGHRHPVSPMHSRPATEILPSLRHCGFGFRHQRCQQGAMQPQRLLFFPGSRTSREALNLARGNAAVAADKDAGDVAAVAHVDDVLARDAKQLCGVSGLEQRLHKLNSAD